MSQYNADAFRLTAFNEYLVLSTGTGEVFLADHEQQNGDQYTFYRLSGIGSYKNDSEAYEYAHASPDFPSDVHVSEKAGDLVTLPVSDYQGIPCVLENGVRYACVSRGERTGGTFSPATLFLAIGDCLFFATKDGHLCLFNTDKRGEDGEIPAEFYTFLGHRYRSGATFPIDDCDFPYLTKNLEKHATILHLCGFSGGRIHLTVQDVDHGSCTGATLHGGATNFSELDFDNFHFGNDKDRVFSLSFGLRHFTRIQYSLYTNDFRARFGLCELSFRYTKGRRIKS